MPEPQGGVDYWPWNKDASTDSAGNTVFTITVSQFGWTLHFEFFERLVGPVPIRKFVIDMHAVALNPSTDRIADLTASCVNLTPHVNEISLAGSPHGNGGRNYSVSITCTAPGIKTGDFFRVRSVPLGGGNPPANQNKNASLELKASGGLPLLKLTNGIGTSWVEHQLTLP